jgi:choline dehydrogenase-like flavoprotein
MRHMGGRLVDFVVVGAGAAGGVVAKELAEAGFKVVVLEQGPYLRERDFRHDEIWALHGHGLTNDPRLQPNTLRLNESETAVEFQAIRYGRAVGGGSVHYTGNYWRFREVDFIERSRTGGLQGTGLEDWPISYAELEPYYTRAEWELGISGPSDITVTGQPRSKPYPLPPLPIKSTGVLAERAANKLGWSAIPSPMAILSQPYQGRSACLQCGFCESFGCEVAAKSSSLATVIPAAERTRRCEIRPNSYVRKIEIDRRGRVTGVVYFDSAKREVFQRARAVVVCANGAETPRLLLMSRSNLFPNGLANSSGLVGRYLMYNGGAFAGGLFEHEINGYRGTHVSRVIYDFYELDPSLGIIGGGGIDTRFDFYPIQFAREGLPADVPRWGPRFKQALRDYFTRSVYALAHTTALPVESNSITLDPRLNDAWGLPAIRVTFQEHDNDQRLYRWFMDRALELLAAAGAVRLWEFPLDTYYPAVHLLGTCRMGNDPRRSVVDRFHRTHDVPNLFLVDGSSFVTGGRGQPTCTIQALAFRAGHEIARLARQGTLGW